MVSGDDVERDSRQWRLRGYPSRKKDEKATHDSTVRGDDALDTALARLERDPEIMRIKAEQL